MFMVKSRKYTSSDIHVSRKNLAVPVFLQVQQVDLRSQMRSKNNRTYYGLNPWQEAFFKLHEGIYAEPGVHVEPGIC
jgi:hypothetical protein